MGKRKQARRLQRPRQIPLTPEVVEVIEQQRLRFIERFGREPGPDDPVFFDLPPVEHIEHAQVQAMEKIGIEPAIIHAYKRTGRLVTAENAKYLTPEDLDEWNEAVEEYREMHR